MENKNDLDKSLSTVDEINGNASPAAASTPEIRRSTRLKATRTPCTCCETGMHERCFGPINARRPIHSPKQSRTPKARNSPRIRRESPVTISQGKISRDMTTQTSTPPKNGQSESAKENDMIIRVGRITRRRSLGLRVTATKRKLEECGEISVTSTDPHSRILSDLNDSPSASKRLCVKNSQAEPSLLKLVTLNVSHMEVNSVTRTENAVNGIEIAHNSIENNVSPADIMENNTLIAAERPQSDKNIVNVNRSSTPIEENIGDVSKSSLLQLVTSETLNISHMEVESVARTENAVNGIENADNSIENNVSPADIMENNTLIAAERPQSDKNIVNVNRSSTPIEENIGDVSKSSLLQLVTSETLNISHMEVESVARTENAVNDIENSVSPAEITEDSTLIATEESQSDKNIPKVNAFSPIEENIRDVSESPLLAEDFEIENSLPETHTSELCLTTDDPIELETMSCTEIISSRYEVVTELSDENSNQLSNNELSRSRIDSTVGESTANIMEDSQQTGVSINATDEERELSSDAESEIVFFREEIEAVQDIQMENQETEEQVIDLESPEASTLSINNSVSGRRCIIL